MKHSNPNRKHLIRFVFVFVFALLSAYRVFAQAPGNDLCANAVVLTSSPTCVTPTAGTVVNATVNVADPGSGACAGTINYDVWYKFTAQTTNPLITLTGVGVNFLAPKIQLLSGSCGALTIVGCNTGLTYNPTGLTVGTTYYIRLFSTSGAAPTTNGAYNICVTDPAPSNDNCANAVTLTGGVVCSNTAGTVNYATVNASDPGSGACGGTVGYDVWYKFIAQTTSPTITLSSVGVNFLVPKIQILSGTCGSLVIVGCATGLSYNPVGLTVGTTYYVRIFSTSGASPATLGGFNICLTDPSNDACANPIFLPSTGSTCVTTSGTLTGASYSAIAAACVAKNDVWFSFTAQSTNPTITTVGVTNPRLQILSGTCAALTSVQCASAATLTAAGLTIGTTYLIRVVSNNNTGGNFTICVTDPAPANDLCAAPTTITPGLTCVNTAGTFYGATLSAAPTISGSCASTATFDVWYSFVAPNANVTVTLSSIGSGVSGTGLELMSGDCTTMYSLGCGTTSVAGSGLIVGNTYYVRVYSTGPALTSSANTGFNICATYTAPPPPANDDCSGAINLPVNGSCSNTSGTVNSATASTGYPTGCASTPTAYDVWYKFTAINSATTTITISGFGTGFGGTQRIQLFSGTCGALTSLACGTTSIAQALTSGATYYVRVYTTTGPAPSANGNFNICITTTNPPPRIGNSYVNITRNTVGGVVQPGDVLEIRMTILLGSGTIYKTRYLDSIPKKTTMLASAADSIRVITNEGLTYKRYTPNNGVNDDPATYVAAPPVGSYSIRMNLGSGAGNWPAAPLNNTPTDLTGAGNLPSTANPRGGGGLMFATSFRVTVTGSVGDTIKLNGGRFIYRTSAAATADSVLYGTPYMILITNPLTLCANAKGINNAAEFGGTFGSGSTLNRTTDLAFPIPGYSFVAASNAQAIGDGQYALVNNTSPISGTNQNANRKPTCPTPVSPAFDCANRMFGGYWYIDGDHTGTSNSAGNLPAASGSPGGYMLAVNADYVASEAYRQTLTGLCPNTYYEFSAWFQNICPVCGIDSTGAQFAGTATSPANGYPGVYPNLSFSLDGLDQYSTGQIDTVGWVKKGFVFLTGPSQTTATLSIRNNAQGGGGNDWVMDDVSIATCFPSMAYSPTATPVVCKGNTITIGDTVRSVFNNYTYYVWQRSTDNGVTWSNLTGTLTASPVLTGGQYQYITNYTVPTTATNPADSGDIYRVYTATTSSNITNPNCVANDGSAPISLSVLNCLIPLKTDLLSFSGNVMNKYAILSWSTSKEDQPVHFDLQKSDDNVNFTTIATLNSKNTGQPTNYYSFTDPQVLTAKKWYRLVLVSDNGDKRYSHIIQLGAAPSEFEVENVINPFSEQLLFNVVTTKSSRVNVELIDMQGRVTKSDSYLVYAGVNSLRLLNTSSLSTGIYTLRIESNGSIINKKVMKQ